MTQMLAVWEKISLAILMSPTFPETFKFQFWLFFDTIKLHLCYVKPKPQESLLWNSTLVCRFQRSFQIKSCSFMKWKQPLSKFRKVYMTWFSISQRERYLLLSFIQLGERQLRTSNVNDFVQKKYPMVSVNFCGHCPFERGPPFSIHKLNQIHLQ